MANSVDLDEVAPHEPPHQDLRRLQIHLFWSLVLKELNQSVLQVLLFDTSRWLVGWLVGWLVWA